MKLHWFRLNLVGLGNAVGIVGILMCSAAVITRLMGEPAFFGLVQPINLFIAGLGVMLLAALAKLDTLITGERERRYHPELYEQHAYTP